MKKAVKIGLSALALTIGGVAFSGLINAHPVETKAEVTNEYFYYRGECSDWASSDSLGGLTVGKINKIHIGVGKFKFCKGADWGTEINVGDIVGGSASSVFTASGTDIYCSTEGDYFVTITESSGDYSVYFDYYYSAFAYAGTRFVDGKDNWIVQDDSSDYYLTIGGAPKRLLLNKNEKFTFTSAASHWSLSLGYSHLASNVGLSDSGDKNNIWVNDYSFYNFSISLTGTYENVLSYQIVQDRIYDGEVFVWDKYNQFTDSESALKGTPKAYLYKDGFGDESAWPGKTISKVAGTKNIYSVPFSTELSTHMVVSSYDESVIRQTFNISLTSNNGKVLLLDETVALDDATTKWNAWKWLSFEAAEFIDGYMKFETTKESDTTSGTNCKIGFDDLVVAYKALDPDVRAEICNLKGNDNGSFFVRERLIEWASANGQPYTYDEGTGDVIYNAAKISSLAMEKDSNQNIILLAFGAASFAFATLAGLVVLKRKRSE